VGHRAWAIELLLLLGLALMSGADLCGGYQPRPKAAAGPRGKPLSLEVESCLYFVLCM
jgi:hypothetical protein